MFKNFNNKKTRAVHVAMSKIPTSNSNDTRIVYSIEIKRRAITIEIRLDDPSGSKGCRTLITLAKKKFFIFFLFYKEIQFMQILYRYLRNTISTVFLMANTGPFQSIPLLQGFGLQVSVSNFSSNIILESVYCAWDLFV